MARWEVPVYLPRRSRTWFQSSRCRKCTCIVLVQIGVFFVCGILFENHTRILKGAISMNKSRLMGVRWGSGIGTENVNQSDIFVQDEAPAPGGDQEEQAAEETKESKDDMSELLNRLQSPDTGGDQPGQQEGAPQLGAPQQWQQESEPEEPVAQIQEEQPQDKIMKGFLQKTFNARMFGGSDNINEAAQKANENEVLPGLLVNPIQQEEKPEEELQPLVGLPPEQEPNVQPDEEYEQGQGQMPPQQESWLQVQQPIEQQQQQQQQQQIIPDNYNPEPAAARNFLPMDQAQRLGVEPLQARIHPIENFAPERLQVPDQNQNVAQPLQLNIPPTENKPQENLLPPANQPLNQAPQQQYVRPDNQSPVQNLPPMNQPMNQQLDFNQPPGNQPVYNQQPPNPPVVNQPPPPPPPPPPQVNPPAQDNPGPVKKNPLLWSFAFQDPSHPNVVDCISGGIIRGYDANTPVTYFEGASLADSTAEDPVLRQQSFTRIHQTKAWLGGAGVDPGHTDIQSSGIGSTITTSLAIRNVLYTVIHELKRITGREKIRILDVPCGDMVWMGQFLQTKYDIEYVGMDIVPELIEHHRAKYADFPNLKFVQGDIINNDLTGTFDLILSRQMTAYLTNKDTVTALGKFSQSGSSFLLATSFPKQVKNVDLLLNDPMFMQTRFREQNLELPPFSLSPPICMYEDVRLQSAYIALWKLPLTQVKNCNTATSPLRNEQYGLYSCA